MQAGQTNIRRKIEMEQTTFIPPPPPPTSPVKYVIVGAGAAGLFTAWRLLNSDLMKDGATVELYEWADKVGGRIRTHKFSSAGDGQFIEAGAMRFAVKDGKHPGHWLLQCLIEKLELQNLVVNFDESDNRLYYLRGHNIWENDIAKSGSYLAYNFNRKFRIEDYQHMTADQILGAVTAEFAGSESSKWTRREWCDFFRDGALTEDIVGFSKDTSFYDIGYWNLLYDYLGEEGYDYVADANGYTSNVINLNSANALYNSTHYGSDVKYKRLDGGYSKLCDKLAYEINQKGGQCINLKTRLTNYRYVKGPTKNFFVCDFLQVDKGKTISVEADYLFLAMPRRSLEMVAAGCGKESALKTPELMGLLSTSFDMPAMRIGMLFKEAWWTDSTIVEYLPDIKNNKKGIKTMGGPTITDLPLRQVYYFGNNKYPTDNNTGGPYVMLASYDDMFYTAFWREVETKGPPPDSEALNGPTVLSSGSTMEQIVLDQLGTLHGLKKGKTIPTPLQTVFLNWGTDPFGAGYHGWEAHHPCSIMEKIRAPGREKPPPPPHEKIWREKIVTGSQNICDEKNLFIIGSCYSIDQGWVEGALCVAESVLQDYLKLKKFCEVPEGYELICKSPKIPKFPGTVF